MRIRWTAQASTDLDNIEAYIALDNRGAAIRTVLDIIDAVKRLEDYPASGRAGRVVGTRELVLSNKPFIVPYRVRNNIIEILRVFHTSRRIAYFDPNL